MIGRLLCHFDRHKPELAWLPDGVTYRRCARPRCPKVL